jgi:hypothetical protein
MPLLALRSHTDDSISRFALLSLTAHTPAPFAPRAPRSDAHRTMAFALRSTARPAVADRPARAPAAGRGAALVVRAGIRAYPDPDFVAETLEAFPEKMIANVEEARVSAGEGVRTGVWCAGAHSGRGFFSFGLRKPPPPRAENAAARRRWPSRRGACFSPRAGGASCPFPGPPRTPRADQTSPITHYGIGCMSRPVA